MNPPALSWKQKASFALAACSGLLLFAAFPPIGASSLAFVGLIPFLWALRWYPHAKGRLSYLAGLCQWIPSLWFLSPVTIPGALLLAAYCALYWVPVGWVWGRLLTGWRAEQTFRSLRLVVGGAAWWCAMDSIRAWLLTGFPWNELAVSQWENYGLIQIASLGGTLAVTFVLVSLNLGIGISVMSLLEQVGNRQRNRMHPELYVPILLLAVSFTWGMREIRRQRAASVNEVRMVVVQPSAENKWTEELARENFQVLEDLTSLAMSQQPDLVIWPETALPEELRYSETSASLVRRLVTSGVPLLVGTLDFITTSEVEGNSSTVERKYFNSSFLVNPAGELQAEYRKQHLVMFGEYLPFGRWLPFLRSLTPMPEDVTPGTGDGVITLPDPELRMGMLICFEDLMANLARDRVKEGAQVFVNQTNDAWFDPLWGSRAHLVNAVFRSIEQRRPTVRATNTGISAWISTTGVVRAEVRDELTGNHRIRGFSPFQVEIPSEPETTFYHRHPRAMVWLCWGLSLLCVTGRNRK